MSKKILSFEMALRKLQEITGELENNELGLEKAISRYEEGVRLAQHCEALLANMEQRVEMISKNLDGTLKTTKIPIKTTDNEEDNING